MRKAWLWLAEAASVGLFSFAGVGVRALLVLAEYPQAYEEVFSTAQLLVANSIAAFAMGLFIHYEVAITRFSPSMYRGLTTGFCGCLSSFSGWLIGCVNNTFAANGGWYKLVATIILDFSIMWASFLMVLLIGIV